MLFEFSEIIDRIKENPETILRIMTGNTNNSDITVWANKYCGNVPYSIIMYAEIPLIQPSHSHQIQIW